MNFSLYIRLSKSQNLAYFLQLNLISYTEPPLHHWWETLSPKLLGFFNLWLYYSFSSKILHRQGLWKNGVFRWGRGKQSTFQSFVHTDYHWSIHCPHLSGSLKIQRFSTVLHHDTDMDFFFFHQSLLGPSTSCAPQIISFLGLAIFPAALLCTVSLSFWDTQSFLFSLPFLPHP